VNVCLSGFKCGLDTPPVSSTLMVASTSLWMSHIRCCETTPCWISCEFDQCNHSFRHVHMCKAITVLSGPYFVLPKYLIFYGLWVKHCSNCSLNALMSPLSCIWKCLNATSHDVFVFSLHCKDEFCWYWFHWLVAALLCLWIWNFYLTQKMMHTFKFQKCFF